MIKKRKEITIDPDVYEKLERLAKDEKRSLNNFIEIILSHFVKNQQDENNNTKDKKR